jgi:hypothetical protein
MKSRRPRSFARIFSRTSESSTKSSRTDPPHSVVMVLRVLDMVVNVVMEIVRQIDQTPMVAVVDMGDTTTHPLPILLAVS